MSLFQRFQIRSFQSNPFPENWRSDSSPNTAVDEAFDAALHSIFKAVTWCWEFNVIEFMTGYELLNALIVLSQHVRQCNAVLWTTPLSCGNIRLLDPRHTVIR
jgi:hypothetical protein